MNQEAQDRASRESQETLHELYQSTTTKLLADGFCRREIGSFDLESRGVDLTPEAIRSAKEQFITDMFHPYVEVAVVHVLRAVLDHLKHPGQPVMVAKEDVADVIRDPEFSKIGLTSKQVKVVFNAAVDRIFTSGVLAGEGKMIRRDGNAFHVREIAGGLFVSAL